MARVVGGGSSPEAAATGTVAATALDAGAVAARFEVVAAMVEAGNPRAAARELVGLAAVADDATASLLRECLQALERPRPVAVARLRWLWTRHPGEDARALIEACVPRTGVAWVPLPDLSAPAWRPDPAAARRPVSAPSTRQGPARGARSAAVAGQARDAARYFEQDAEVGGIEALAAEQGPDGWDYPGAVADEAAALVAVTGTTCVACFVERPVAEQRRTGDDGLCECCRDRGVPGIVCPAGADRATRLRARLADLVARHPHAVRGVLRGEWRRARGADKQVIVDWVDHHLPT